MAEPAEKPTRRWFQFHLSTAVVVMVVASLILWVNLESKYSSVSEGFYFHGWPYWFLTLNEHFPIYEIDWRGLIKDFSIWVSILTEAAVVCELVARHPRRWFKLHLGTAMVLILIASGLIWANVAEQSENVQQHSWRGWPIPFVFWTSKFGYDFDSVLTWQRILADLTIALLILAAVATVCEMIARRRKHG